MNEDLKIDIYQRVVKNIRDAEKEAVKKTVCVLYAEEFENGMKEIYFYSSDFMDEGEDSFQMDYNIEYDNGKSLHGDCMVNTKELVNAFGFTDYDELKAYFAEKYSDDENAWKEIIKEINDKGLYANEYEDEGELMI